MNSRLIRTGIPGFVLLLLFFQGAGILLQQEAEAVRQKRAPLAEGVLATPVTQREEIYTGAQLDRIIREHYPPVQNVALQAYVSAVGKKIADVSYKPYPFTYSVLADTRTADAFAGPGGFLYLTAGLINMLESEAQLAALLSHQTAHAIKRHGIKQIQEQNEADLLLFLPDKAGDLKLDNRLNRLGELILRQRFHPQDEYEADIIATQFMARAGYHPAAMVQLLDKLNQLESRGVFIPFLQSHPSSEARGRILEEYIERMKLAHPNQIMDRPQFHQVVE